MTSGGAHVIALRRPALFEGPAEMPPEACLILFGCGEALGLWPGEDPPDEVPGAPTVSQVLGPTRERVIQGLKRSQEVFGAI